MRFRRVSLAVGFAGSILLAGGTANAAHTSHPGYSAKGGSVSATQWNLLCDPANAIYGSTTTDYHTDLGVAALNSITAAPGFEIDDIYVEVNGDGQFAQELGPFPIDTTSVPITGLIGSEVGYVQVDWSNYQLSTQKPGGLSRTAALPITDTDTHTVTFDNISGNPLATATFTNYGDAGYSNPGGIFPNADQYTLDNGDGTTTTYSADPNSTNYPQPGTVYSDGTVGLGGIASETVTLALLPEPSLVGCLGFGSLLLRRRR